MPVGVSIFSLLQPLNTILVVRPIRKAWINLIIHSSRPFFLSIYRSLSYNTWLKAPLISRLSIDTTHPGRACHAAQTLEVIREIAKRVNRFFLAPICVYGSRPCASTASYMRSATIFSSILPSVFSRAIGRQLPSREQSFLFAFRRITIIVSLQHSGRLPLRRQVVAALASGIATASNTALIASFRILSSLAALLVGSFRIISFISFSKTIWLISIGRGRS